jgi:hypothetical protein
MNKRRVLSWSYLLLIVMMFAASCEDPQSTTNDKPTSQEDSLRRADSLWHLDSIRLTDSMRVADSLHLIDSLHISDSLHTLDSLAEFKILSTPPQTLIYGVYEHGKDTTFNTVLSTAAYDGKLALKINGARITIGFNNFKGVGDYEEGDFTFDPNVKLTIGSMNYTSDRGGFTISKFDTVALLVSGSFKARLSSELSDTMLNIVGAFEDLKLSMPEIPQTPSTLKGAYWGVYTYYFEGNKFDETTRVLSLKASAHDECCACRVVKADVYYKFSMEISDPHAGLFINNAAKWSESESITHKDPRCGAGSYSSYTSGQQDSLMITAFDAVKREMSGWFTANGSKGELKNVRW